VEVWAHKISLTLSFFIEVSLPSHDSQQSCICVLGVSILPVSTIFPLDFINVPTVWYFDFSFLFPLPFFFGFSST
jgi:hypothetical protein